MLTFFTALLLSSLSLHATDNVYLQIYYFCADKHGKRKLTFAVCFLLFFVMLTFLTALLLSSLSLPATDNAYLQIYYFALTNTAMTKKLNDEKAVAFATA